MNNSESFQLPEVRRTPSRFRNPIGKYRLHRTSACVACGKCARRCPVNAIELRNREDVKPPEKGMKLKPRDRKEWVYNPDYCIGCGVCVHKCPTQSIRLARREVEADIPDSFSEGGRRMLVERNRDFSSMF